jgi:HSP20 family protein
MALYDPFTELDRIFNSTLRQVPAVPGLPLDLYRDGDNYIAKVDLPGIDPSTIDIDVEGRTLRISAERKGESGDNLQWLTHERPVGTFARQLTLGGGVALDNISAAYTDGVLTLTIPVAEAAKPRKITVNVQSGDHTIEGAAAPANA